MVTSPQWGDPRGEEAPGVPAGPAAEGQCLQVVSQWLQGCQHPLQGGQVLCVPGGMWMGERIWGMQDRAASAC